MRCVATVLLSCCVAWPAPAAADEARSLLTRGVALLNGGEFERAAEVLEVADRRAEDGPLRAQIRLHRGLVAAMLGRFDAAGQHFAAALALDAKLTVDPSHYGPKIHALFRAARGRLRGELDVATDPAGAVVRVDGRKVGRTPVRLSLRIGEHVVRLESRRARRRVTRVVSVEPGQRATLRVRLGSRRGAARGLRLWTWISGGAAVAAAGAGLGLYLAAGAQVDEHDAEPDPARRTQLASSIRGKELGALICGGAAAGLAATAVVLLVLDHRAAKRRQAWSAARRRAWVAPMIGSTGGIAAGGVF